MTSLSSPSSVGPAGWWQDEGPPWLNVLASVRHSRRTCAGSTRLTAAQLCTAGKQLESSSTTARCWSAAGVCGGCRGIVRMALTGGVRGTGRQVGGDIGPVGPVRGPAWKHGHGHMQGTQVMEHAETELGNLCAACCVSSLLHARGVRPGAAHRVRSAPGQQRSCTQAASNEAASSSYGTHQSYWKRGMSTALALRSLLYLR